MATKLIEIPRRLTWKYKAAFKDEDKWDFDSLLRIKQIGGRSYDPETKHARRMRHGRKPHDLDPSEGPQYQFRVVLLNPGQFDEDDIFQRLYDHYDYGGCSHEYDCCGCASGHASILKTSRKNELLIKLDTTYNY